MPTTKPINVCRTEDKIQVWCNFECVKTANHGLNNEACNVNVAHETLGATVPAAAWVVHVRLRSVFLKPEPDRDTKTVTRCLRKFIKSVEHWTMNSEDYWGFIIFYTTKAESRTMNKNLLGIGSYVYCFSYISYIVPSPCLFSERWGVNRANSTHQAMFTEGGNTGTWH